MAIGRCYCHEIASYRADCLKLTAAQGHISKLSATIFEVDAALKGLKQMMWGACDVDMAGYNPSAFNQCASDSRLSAVNRINERKTSVEQSIRSMTARDSTYHHSLKLGDGV
jgi:hypothetical protein